MHGYLVGYTNPDDFIGQLGRILQKVSENPKIVLKPEFRYKFLYTPTDQVLTFEQFKQDSKPYEWIKPKPKPEQKPEPKPQKKRLIDRIRDLFKEKEHKPKDDYIRIIEPEQEPKEDENERLEQEDEESLGFLGEPDEEW